MTPRPRAGPAAQAHTQRPYEDADDPSGQHRGGTKGTVQRENAAIGVFITLEPPSHDMTTEAVTAGFYHSPSWGRDYPRIQILPVADLLHGAEVKMPAAHGTFKQPQKAQQTLGQQPALAFEAMIAE